jgi:hypothetical protein
MVRSLRNLGIGRLAILALVMLGLAAAWIVWWAVPSGPAEILTMNDPRAIESNFGPTIPMFEGMLCGTGVDWSKFIRAPDRTWTVCRESDNSLSISEPGKSQPNRKLPPADYRWVAGSSFGRRLGAQVGNQFQVWDAESGRLIRQWTTPAHRYQLSSSGRHIFTLKNNEFALEVIEIDSGREVVRLKRRSAMGPHDGSESPKLSSLEGVVFSPEGHWAMLLVQDIDFQCWLWLWDLQSGEPTWLKPVADFKNSIAGNPHFDASGRYLSLACSPPFSLLDLSTSPPTDLSELVAGFETNVQLADRRALAVNYDSNEMKCRIWDLDARKLTGAYPMFCLLDHEPIRSPDNRLVLLTESMDSTQFDKWRNRVLEWLGRPLPNQACYRVVDLETGQTVNRFVADRPTQFDADLQSVWVHSCTLDERQEIWQRYPLRGSGPPWWLWGSTAVGGLLSIGCLRRQAR